MIPDSDANKDAIVAKLLAENAAYEQQVRILKKFKITHWLVGLLGVIIFSQAASFGRWNKFQDIETNFNEHALLLSGCGLGLILISAATFALHQRLERVERDRVDKTNA